MTIADSLKLFPVAVPSNQRIIKCNDGVWRVLSQIYIPSETTYKPRKGVHLTRKKKGQGMKHQCKICFHAKAGTSPLNLYCPIKGKYVFPIASCDLFQLQ
jgi:hypothetical protein